MVYRIYVEKQPAHAVEARSLFADIRENLMISGLTGLRVLNRYDVEGIDEEVFAKAKNTIFSEPQSDIVYDEVKADGVVFAVEYLPGQFDQRADSCAQCIQLLTYRERPRVRTARVYILSGNISESDVGRIKHYVINPVESREASLDKPETLADNFHIPTTVETIDGFISMDEKALHEFLDKYALAMDFDDVCFCQKYFRDEEKRDPTISEIRLIDSYWSDHCRHTTFLTSIENVKIGDEYVKETFEDYLEKRKFVYGERLSKKNVTLMDMATIAAKYLKKTGVLKNLDESEEINACSVKIKVDIDGKPEDWLFMFKNETHNHPTEIEPFGGAATCLGGAIRDPLSGRSYVYQAMRVTGCADPRVPVSETLPGKLPQSKITHGASSGYSSYGNQIGLATGAVYELYHPDYVAKHLEIGAVVGAAPAKNVVRERPIPGDEIILLGGRTGRDGCGGATGSSKAHTASSLDNLRRGGSEGQPAGGEKAPETVQGREGHETYQALQRFRRGRSFGRYR